MATLTSFIRFNRNRAVIAAGRSRRVCGVLLMLMISAGTAGCSSVSTLVMRPDFPPPGRELQLGRQAYQHHLVLHPPIEDPRPTAIVEAVGNRLAEASGRDDLTWEFVVSLNPARRVVAFPGGKVVISDGMLAACKNEAQLAAVMSREMGHMLAGHRLQRLLEIDPEFAAGDAPTARSNPKLITAFGGDASTSAAPFAPHQEEEADSIALSLLVRAGYDPDVVRSVWIAGHAHQTENGFDGRSQQPIDQDRRFSIMETLAQAKVVYRSHSDPLGDGDPIAYTARAPREALPQLAASPIDSWTPVDQRGGSKPAGWNADLAEAEWLPPTDGDREATPEVLQVEYKWTAPSKGRTNSDKQPAESQQDESSSGPMLRLIERDDSWEPPLRPIE